MDPYELRRRYPQLILCGTIDVSQLLPFGSPQEIRDQVVRNIEATEGRIMVGSSTELMPVCLWRTTWYCMKLYWTAGIEKGEDGKVKNPASTIK